MTRLEKMQEINREYGLTDEDWENFHPENDDDWTPEEEEEDRAYTEFVNSAAEEQDEEE